MRYAIHNIGADKGFAIILAEPPTLYSDTVELKAYHKLKMPGEKGESYEEFTIGEFYFYEVLSLLLKEDRQLWEQCLKIRPTLPSTLQCWPQYRKIVRRLDATK